MSTEKATARPWAVDPKRRLRVESADGTTICSTGTSDSIRDQWEVNAELIVTAVNAFDDLVAALEFAIPQIEYKTSHATNRQARHLAAEAINKARAALKKAGKQLPEDMKDMYESSKPDRTMFVGSVCYLIGRITALAAELDRLQGQYDTELSANHGCQRELAQVRAENAELRATIERLSGALRSIGTQDQSKWEPEYRNASEFRTWAKSVANSFLMEIAPPTPQAAKEGE